MKKSILALSGIIVVVIAAGIFYLTTNLDSLVKAAIEKHGSEAVKTSVRVNSVTISLGDAAATIIGFTVSNPDGYSLPLAFSLGEIAVDLDIDKTSEKMIAIDLIRIGEPQVFYEINAERKDNLGVLKDNLGIGSGKPGKESAEKDSPAIDPVRLSIKRFELKGAVMKAKIVPLKNKEYDIKLPALKLTDLKGTPEEISKQVLSQLIDHAKKEIRRKGLDKELAEIKARMEAKAKAKVDDAKSDLKEKAKKKISDKLKGLSW